MASQGQSVAGNIDAANVCGSGSMTSGGAFHVGSDVPLGVAPFGCARGLAAGEVCHAKTFVLEGASGVPRKAHRFQRKLAFALA